MIVHPPRQMWTAARTCMKSAGLKMQRFLARHWLAEPTAAASARSHQQAQDQRLPQRRSGEPGKKEEEVSAELAKKKPGRTYNFKPAVLMHFRFAADNAPARSFAVGQEIKTSAQDLLEEFETIPTTVEDHGQAPFAHQAPHLLQDSRQHLD